MSKWIYRFLFFVYFQSIISTFITSSSTIIPHITCKHVHITVIPNPSTPSDMIETISPPVAATSASSTRFTARLFHPHRLSFTFTSSRPSATPPTPVHTISGFRLGAGCCVTRMGVGSFTLKKKIDLFEIFVRYR